MKTFWKIFVAMALLLAIIGCKGVSSSSGKKLVGDVTVKYGEEIVSVDNGLTINTGETVTLTASADGADFFSFQADTSGIVTINGLSITGAVTGTSAQTTTITCTATNESDNANTTTFIVTVRPKLESFDVMYGSNPVNYLAGVKRPLGAAANLIISFVPASAENSFIWEIPENSTLDVTDIEGGKSFTAATAVDVVVTVKPAQAGLSETEKTILTKTFNVIFSADVKDDPVKSLTIHYTDASGAVIANNDIVPLKRGRSTAIYAKPDVSDGTTVTWAFTDAKSIVSNTGSGQNAVFNAEDGNDGANVIVTVSAANFDNNTPITQTFTIDVPDRGSTLFEWYADENPDEEDLADGAIRNYPGFRDVWISTTATTTAAPTPGRVIAFNGEDFEGMKVGNTPENYGTTATQTSRLVIGITPNANEDGTILSGGITGAGNTDAGTFDLTTPVKLTLEFANYTFNSGGNVRIYVNNNSTGAASSNISNASQIKHYSAGTGFIENSELSGGNAGTYSCIIDFSDLSMYVPYPPDTNITNAFNNLNMDHIKNAFICVAPSNTANNWIILTGISVNKISKAGINVNRDAYFGDFPNVQFTVSGSQSKNITLSGSAYTGIEWYIDGQVVAGASAETFTVSKGSLSVGEHSLTALVTVDGKLYSKTVRFTAE